MARVSSGEGSSWVESVSIFGLERKIWRYGKVVEGEKEGEEIRRSPPRDTGLLSRGEAYAL